ncbi:MAG: mucoidy inhibitor MuiA family protein [Chloroflexi bacterium]|nr:mucoidy inhibitor MuiA family protein [Chloroflexota bacterium]
MAMADVESHITAVTVFTDRARVTRRGTAAVEPGAHRLDLTELPRGLDPASVRTSARGTARATVLGVDVRRAFFADTPAIHVRELEERIEALEDQDRSLVDRADTLTRQLAHLDGLADATRVYAAGLATGKTTVEAQRSLIDFVAATRAETQEQIRTVAAERRTLARELQQRRSELDQLRGARPRERHTASIEMAVSAPGDLEVDVTYMLGGAAWSPLYDIRLAGADLELMYLGEVTQATGEDWTEVELTLSTATPALAGVLPELEPWFITPYVPPPMPPMPRMAAPMAAVPTTGAHQTARIALADLMSEAARPPSPIVEAEIATAGVEQSGASVTFRIGGTVDIPGDGSPRKTTIAFARLPHRLDYVTAPRLAAAAYRRVRARNDSPYLLLPGRAQLFDGDDYLGATRIELTAVGQELELYFGVDDRMRVERELAQRDVDRRLIGDRRRISYAYAITLENHTGAAQTITVHDQMPVGRHEDIKVKLDAADPRPAALDDLGRLEWRLDIGPGEKRPIRFDFTVEYPRAMSVAGLP